MQSQELFAVVFTLGMFMGVFIIYMGLRQRSEQLQMLHRERMAMIEKGQIPLNDGPGIYESRRLPSAVPSSRSLSLGIIVVGLGLALMTIIGVAGESPEIGIGVGGAVAILGASFIIRSLMVRPTLPQPSHSSPPFDKLE